MIDQDEVATVLRWTVIAIVVESVFPDLIQAMITPTTENLSEMVVAGAVSWWVPIAESPILFLGMIYVFNWAGVEDLLEV